MAGKNDRLCIFVQCIIKIITSVKCLSRYDSDLKIYATLPHNNNSGDVHLSDLTLLSGATAVVVLLNITTLSQSLLGTWTVRTLTFNSMNYSQSTYFRFAWIGAHHVLLPVYHWDN